MTTVTLSPLFKGSKFHLHEVVVDGKHLLREFIDGLSEDDQKKIAALLKTTAELGVPKNEQKFKKLQDGLFEFKSYQIRIFCAFHGKAIIVLTHGIIKKKNKHDKNDIDKAIEILKKLNEKR